MMWLPHFQGSTAAMGGGVTNFAVTFDGTNDYMTRAAQLTGAADSKLFTGSFWLKSAQDGGSGYRIFCLTNGVGGAANITRIVKSATNLITILGFDSTDTQILSISSTANSNQIADGWVHVMFSVDMADTAKRFLYINNTSDLATVTTYTDAAIDFTKPEAALGANGDGTVKLVGDLYDVWFAPGVYIDLSDAGNRAKFISGGAPVSLGTDGSTPTGTAPLMFFSGAVSAWHTNKGSGGGFTLAGALAQASSNPP